MHAFAGRHLLTRCSGFWVDWDEESKTGLVLTTARLIRTKDAPVSVWSGGEEYATDDDVIQCASSINFYICMYYLLQLVPSQKYKIISGVLQFKCFFCVCAIGLF